MAIANVLFLPWPMWAKLSFVLGGLFVIVFVIAAIVKVILWRKNVKLEKVAAIQQAERGEMIQSTRVSNEIPFGIKAMEAEPEVEGVWNSRTTTPLHTPPGSRGASPRIIARHLQRSRRGSSVSSLSKLDAAEARPNRVILPETAPEQNLASNNLPHIRRKKSSSVVINYNRSSKMRSLSDGREAGEQFAAICTNPGVENTPPKLRLRPSVLRRASQHRKFVIGGRNSPQNRNNNPKEDGFGVIQDMEAHRRLHSAESGQLVRKITQLVSLDGTGGSLCQRSNSLESDSTMRAVSWPSSGGDIRLSGQLSQKPVQIHKISAVPLTASIESNPAPRPCPSAWTERTQQLVNEKLSIRSVSNTSTLPVPSMISTTTLSISTVTNDNFSNQNNNTGKLNDGFEILPADSLEEICESSGLKSRSEELKNVFNEPKKPRKLRKRSRSGSVSLENSSESERLQGVVLDHIN